MSDQPLPQPQRPQPAVLPAAPVPDLAVANQSLSLAPETITPPPTPPASTVPISLSAATPVSKLMQNLRTVSSQPFQDPHSLGAPQVGALVSAPSASSAPAAASSGTPFVPASVVPQEAPQPVSSSLDPVRGRKVAAQSGALAGGLKGLLTRKVMLLGGAVVTVALLAVGAWVFFGMDSRSPSLTPTQAPPTGRQVTLTYWGLWEPDSVMNPIIAQYESENPGVKIEYIQQNSREYRQRLQAAIRDGSGPDLYRFHNTWVPMLKADLSPAPATVLSAADLQQDFYPVVGKDLVSANQVLGVPLMYDGLALLYNQNMLQAANALPPTDWQQVRELALRLTLKNGQRIERGGIALGTAGNVDHFSDILALMMLQNSADPANPVSVKAQSALEFYTIFSRVDQVWDSTLPPSTQAFASEQVAMIFAPSWRIHEIQKLNPNINIGVARIPQIDGTQVTWASYWAEGVSSTSQYKEESWKFLSYLGQPEQLRALHSAAGSVRGYGELYPRVSMASELKTNPLLAPYLDDALYAQSWYLAGDTLDEGLNDGLIQYYTDAVNTMNQSGNAMRALQDILPGLQQVLARYGLVSTVVAQ